MKSRIQLFICFFITSCCILQSQQQKELQGKVVAQGKDVTGVVVRNINSRKATITDEKGNFSIAAKQNDTLIFLAVQFKNKIIPLTAEVFNTSFITVPLEEFVNELNEVIVSPYNLSGDIDKDIQNLKLEKDVSAEALGLPNADVKIATQSERQLYDADHGKFFYYYVVGAAININKILNRISGRTKMLKKRVAVDKKYAQTQLVQDAFVDSLFIDSLKIPNDSFSDFMYFCEVDEDFDAVVKTDDQLKIWEFLINKSEVYRKNNNLD